MLLASKLTAKSSGSLVKEVTNFAVGGRQRNQLKFSVVATAIAATMISLPNKSNLKALTNAIKLFICALLLLGFYYWSSRSIPATGQNAPTQQQTTAGAHLASASLQNSSTSQFEKQCLQYHWCNSPYNFDLLSHSMKAALYLVVKASSAGPRDGERERHASRQAANSNLQIPSTVRLVTATYNGRNGGLGDRLRALFPLAVVALLTKRELRVEPQLLYGGAARGSILELKIQKEPRCFEKILSAAMSDSIQSDNLRVSTDCLVERQDLDSLINKLAREGKISAERLNAARIITAFCSGEYHTGAAYSQDKATTGGHALSRGYVCGPMFLHAAVEEHSPDIRAVLVQIHEFFQSWRAFVAPNGYNAIHIRTGAATLRADGSQLSAVPWPDSDVCGEHCSEWLTKGPQIARKSLKSKHLPVAIASDSALLVGWMQKRYWNTLPLLHCCGSTMHVHFGDALAGVDSVASFKQAAFDLALVGNAKRTFVSRGGFWLLGVHWWTPNATTSVFRQAGPAETIPQLV